MELVKTFSDKQLGEINIFRDATTKRIEIRIMADRIEVIITSRITISRAEKLFHSRRRSLIKKQAIARQRKKDADHVGSLEAKSIFISLMGLIWGIIWNDFEILGNLPWKRKSLTKKQRQRVAVIMWIIFLAVLAAVFFYVAFLVNSGQTF